MHKSLEASAIYLLTSNEMDLNRNWNSSKGCIEVVRTVGCVYSSSETYI
jgi:hypothetical protein